MANKYSMIRQHQPLRTPAGWSGQEKAFIVQLEEIFDDIYRKFGRLGMNDMDKKFRVTIDGKYDIVSGIEINENGIEVSGSKYVNIISGGKLYVSATNFEIDSENKYMRCGDWYLDEKGMHRYSYYIGSYLPSDLPGSSPCIRMYTDVSFTLWQLCEAGQVESEAGLYFEYDINTGKWANSFHADNLGSEKGISIGKNGSIRYQGTKNNSDLIRFVDNTVDQYGNGIAIGDGGLVVVGAGESAQQVLNNAGVSGGTENLYLASDNAIFFLSNVQNGFSSARTITLNLEGQFEREPRPKSWYNGRDGAIIRNNITAVGSSAYNPIFSAKSNAGSWEGGTFQGNIFCLSYITDTNYSNGNNTYDGQYTFKPLNAGTSKEVSDAITNISRSGDTFTATRMNGDTFTFTQRGLIVQNYDATYTVNANTFHDITANDFGATAPAGYSAVAVSLFNPGNDKCWVSAINVHATGTTPMMTVHNPTGNNLTNHAYISILYLQN